MNRYAHVVVPTTPLYLQLLSFLRSLRAVLAPPGTWTHEASARAVTGQPLSSGTHPDATCWCLTGAIERVRWLAVDTHEYTPRIDGIAAGALCDTLVRRHVLRRTADPMHALVLWNDVVWRRHSEVLELIDDTIANVERTAPRWLFGFSSPPSNQPAAVKPTPENPTDG